MNIRRVLIGALALGFCLHHAAAFAAEAPPAIPRFSIEHMDRSVEPGVDFYRFAAGTWLKNNPIPADKSRWSGFEQLRERNWHLLRAAAPYLHREVEEESFAFYGKTLRVQPQQEPRWQRAARTIDGTIGEALGKLYVEKHFPPAARARMNELVGNLRVVFLDRLKGLEWMSAETRAKGAAKFDRFTQKIGHPEKFRDYSKVKIRRDDLIGNVQRAAVVESRREAARVGQAVDRLEWHMTPQTVNAYLNPLANEIVFPAGILQPPFFDLELDDAIS